MRRPIAPVEEESLRVRQTNRVTTSPHPAMKVGGGRARLLCATRSADRSEPQANLALARLRLALAGLHQPAFVREDDRLHAVPQPELSQQMGDVRLHGPFAEKQMGSELCVALAGGEQPQDFALAVREALETGVVLRR